MRRKSFYIFTLILAMLSVLSHKQAQAETNVNLSNNAEGSTSRVTINSTTSTTNGTTNNESHVRIETNGEVKTFDTNGDESVDWQSSDGKNSVKINTKTASLTNQQSSGKATTAPEKEKQASSSPTPTKMVKNTKSTSMTFNLAAFFAKIFSFFKFNTSK